MVIWRSENICWARHKTSALVNTHGINRPTTADLVVQKSGQEIGDACSRMLIVRENAVDLLHSGENCVKSNTVDVKYHEFHLFCGKTPVSATWTGSEYLTLCEGILFEEQQANMISLNDLFAVFKENT